MVASDRISTYDVVHPTAIPDKGKVLTGLSVLWFGLTAGIVPNHLLSATDGVPEEHARARAARQAARDAAGRVRRARLHHRLGLEGLPAATGSVSGIELPAGLQESEQLPEPIFTPVDEGRRGPRRGDRPRRRPPSWSARTSWPSGCATSRSPSTAPVAEHAPRARRDPRRHEVRVRLRRGRDADARRRGLHAGLLALLARRPVRGRARPAVVRQAVRARLGVRHRLGQGAARAARSPTTSSPPRASAT